MTEIEKIEKYRQIIEMTRMGMDAWSIAEAMGFQTGRDAKKFLRKALKEFCSETAEEIRAQELSRLEELEKELWGKARAGVSDRQCIEFDRLLKVIQMRLEWSGARPAPLAPVSITDNRLQVVVLSLAEKSAQGDSAVSSRLLSDESSKTSNAAEGRGDCSVSDSQDELTKHSQDD